MSIKILHIITGLNQGGAERQLSNLVTALPESSVVFSLLSPGVMATEIQNAGVSVFAGHSKGSNSAVWIPALYRVLRNTQPDLVLGWMYHGNLAASFAKWMGYQGAVLWNVRHSIHDIRLEKLRTRWVIRAGAWCGRSPIRIIYNSATAAQQHEELGYPAGKRMVLPNGFDLDRFKPDPEARHVRRAELGVPKDRFLLGVVGRSHPMKNHLGWLAAFRALVNDGLPVHCVMAGTGVADPIGPVTAAVRDSGLESNVTLLPPTSVPESLYPALDLLVMPSLGEGFPNVVGEAMACGVPALVTDVGDAGIVVGETGFVAGSTTSAGLAEAVRNAIRPGRARLTELGQLARKRMIDNYSIESVAQRYQALFKDILAE